MLGSSAHIRVRSGRPRDAEALAHIFRESWRLAYLGIIPRLHLEGMIQRRDARWWRKTVSGGDGLLVLELADEVVGYATYGGARWRGAERGEIFELYLEPRHQGLGFGEYLFEGCRHQLDRRSLPGLVVWALSANEAAIAFYWRRGGRPVAKARERLGGSDLEKIAFTWD